ncbi:6-phosphogluconate dehydrogenase (decarboxylating) [Candidatus Microgenomates bacterium]|nr:MAG: 6-phosphogluconate dehydrogenase (decarboxylating) [Candidatus Microgenomates bacterium]
MNVGIIGLGRMGGSIALHLVEQGVHVVAYNRSREKVDEFAAAGGDGAYSLNELSQKLGSDAVVFLFVPAGEVVDEMLFGSSLSSPARSGIHTDNSLDSRLRGNDKEIKGLVGLLPKDVIIVDGGNSFFQDSQKRARLLKEKGFTFLDMGTSGGIDGARHGACLMVGGDEAVYKKIESVLSKIATKDGYGYVGTSGAGHFVKMVHNAVEYGMMGAIAEGFNHLSASPFRIDFKKVASIWAHGSIVSGHLMNMAERAFVKDAQLEQTPGEVPKGETEKEMEWLETQNLPMPVIAAARQERVDTRSKPSFIGRVIAALRHEFGGHKVKSK